MLAQATNIRYSTDFFIRQLNTSHRATATVSTPTPSKCRRNRITTNHQTKVVRIISVLQTTTVITTVISRILRNQARIVGRVVVYLVLNKEISDYTVEILLQQITTILSSLQKRISSLRKKKMTF